MFLLNTDRAVLLPVSLENNVCSVVFAGDKMELKKDKTRQLSLYPPHLLDRQMKSCSSFPPLYCCFSFVQLGPVLSMTKWQMTTSQAVRIRLNRVACGWFS